MSDNLPEQTADADKASFFAELEKLKPTTYDVPKETQQKYEALLGRHEVQTGLLATIPNRCGPTCLYGDACPKRTNPEAKADDPCPVESAIVYQLFTGYMEELDVDPSRLVEIALVRDLVNQDVQQMRASAVLSSEHFIQEVVAGVNEKGEVVTQPDLHKAVDYEDRILKRKEKLRNALLATRESQSKAGQKRMDDARTIAEMMRDVRQLENKIDKENNPEEDYDPYIDAEVVEDDADDGR